MVATVRGIYEDGFLYLEESLPEIAGGTKVLITFLDEEVEADSPIYQSGVILPVKVR